MKNGERGCEELHAGSYAGSTGSLSSPHSAQATRIFRGPRVRIGVCFGDAKATIHPETGRATYPSRLANRASRVAGLAALGQTLASQRTVDVAALAESAEEGAEAERARPWAAEELGEAELKGLREAILVAYVYSPVLLPRPMPAVKLKATKGNGILSKMSLSKKRGAAKVESVLSSWRMSGSAFVVDDDRSAAWSGREGDGALGSSWNKGNWGPTSFADLLENFREEMSDASADELRAMEDEISALFAAEKGRRTPAGHR